AERDNNQLLLANRLARRIHTMMDILDEISEIELTEEESRDDEQSRKALYDWFSSSRCIWPFQWDKEDKACLTDSLTWTIMHESYELQKALGVLNDKVQPEIQARDISSDGQICKVSVVGIGMRSHVGVASQMFETLAAEGINIQMISTSEIKISVVIADKYMELAVRSLHKAFGLADEGQPA
ncbi:MAG: ACT domain-containing protein, partial [Burkholderiaceae bacterium]